MAAMEEANCDCSQSRSQSSNNNRASSLNQTSEEDNQEGSSAQVQLPCSICEEENHEKSVSGSSPQIPEAGLGNGGNDSSKNPEAGTVSSIKTKMNSWIDTLKGTTPQSEVSLNVQYAVEPSADEPPKSGIPPSIDFDDIIDEIVYWESAMICYVLGANPPLKVMEGFVHRKWKLQGLDKLVGIGKGVFLARFHDKDNMLKVYNGDHIFFDSKPLIMKPWTPDIDVMKDDVKTVPMWIKLPGLDLKYWGVKALTKICSGVGKFIKPDNPTLDKDKLQFARVLIETELDAPLPDSITFINEKGNTITQVIKYDWKPTVCTSYKGFGHEGKNCRRGTTAIVKRWIPKVKQTEPPSQPQQLTQQQNQRSNDLEDEGFTPIKRKPPTPQKLTDPSTDGSLPMNNKFALLTGGNTEELVTLDAASMPKINDTHGGMDCPLVENG
ncbi:uncharacterized protein LOC130808151 [Amaranthus tricolor]|uniref:uncharacterized protein LOC130808151 n=1 Tax=Amaranthus tricolor TaxID=29722 RepID=UPI00258D2587|nr:uncharacterized protein LOC130808151 [Amaranthus tricolor]